MTVPLFVPFINKPDVTGQIPVGITTAYTVPAGKYARVTVNLSCSSIFSLSGNPAALTQINPSVSSNSLSFSIWLKAGDVITVSNSAPSSSQTISANLSATVSVATTATATYNINGNAYSISASGSAMGQGGSTGSGPTTFTISTSASSMAHYEEYIEPV
jgi:hypothetical protein